MAAEACSHFPKSQFQTRLNGSERYAGVCGDFAMSHLLVKSEINGGALGFRKRRKSPLQVRASFAVRDVLVNMRPALAQHFTFVSVPILDPRIRLAFAEAIDRTAACECSDPCKRSPHLGIVARRAIPDFHENILQKVVAVGIVVQNFHADGSEESCITGMEDLEPEMIVRLDHFHQVLIREFGVRSD